MKNLFLLGIGLVFIVGSFYLFLEKPISPSIETPAPTESVEAENDYIELQVGETTVLAELADTPAKRQQGLSGRESLEQGYGMLFVFDDTKPQGIWMKDMLISIDIVWMDEEKKIIWIESDVSPDTYPNVFYPKSASKYVLELPARFTTENGIEIGDTANFKHK